MSLLCLAPVGVGAQSVTLDVVEDSWIHGLASSSTSGGSSTRLSICPSADYWIYLKFDLSTLAGRSVADAELRATRFGGSRPEEISLYLIPDDTWSEATLAGTTRPAPKAPDPATKLAIGEELDGFDRWSGVGLAEAVQSAARDDGLLTLMIREDPDNQLDVRNYYSREGAPGPGEIPKLVVTLAAEESVAPGWTTVDVGAGTKPAFDFGPDGRVHVTAMTEEQNGVVWYAAAPRVEGPWSPRTIARGYFYGPGDLRVDPEGVAHVAWHNHDQEDPSHAGVSAQGEATIYPIPSPGHNGWDNSLALDGAGGLHQTSVNPSGFGAETSLEYGVFDGDGWTYGEVPGSGSFMYGLATSLAIDRTGEPHVAYCLASGWTTPGELRYAVRAEGGWSISTVVGDGPVGRFPALALDHWDRPHIVWLDVDPADSTRAFVSYGVLNAGEWEVEQVDVLERVDLSFGGARKSVSIALDGESRPHIAYGDQKVVRYAVKPFGAWEVTPVLEHPDEIYKGLVVLRPRRERTAGVYVLGERGSRGAGSPRVPGERRRGSSATRRLHAGRRAQHLRRGLPAGAPLPRLSRCPPVRQQRLSRQREPARLERRRGRGYLRRRRCARVPLRLRGAPGVGSRVCRARRVSAGVRGVDERSRLVPSVDRAAIFAGGRTRRLRFSQSNSDWRNPDLPITVVRDVTEIPRETTSGAHVSYESTSTPHRRLLLSRGVRAHRLARSRWRWSRGGSDRRRRGSGPYTAGRSRRCCRVAGR